MKTAKQIGMMIALFCTLFFIQCSSDENKKEDEETTEHYSDEINLLREFISTNRHYNIKKIAYDSDRSVFIIEGDILISLEDVRSDYNEFNKKSTSKSKQRIASYIVAPEIAKAIKIYVYPEVSLDWQIAITEAVKNWNGINSNISITIVTTLGVANIKVTAENKGRNGTIAEAFSSTSTGRPGSNIYINSAYNTLEVSNKIFAMTHELGHTLGLDHNNDPDGFLIPCTPISDPSSIMVPINDVWKGFSYYDNVAISTLYPVAVGAKKLYRYKKNQYFFYSINPCEITPGKDGYIFDGEAGYLYSTQVLGTVPLYRSVNGDVGQGHKLSKSQTSSSDVLLGYIYSEKVSGTTALYCIKNVGQFDRYTTKKEDALIVLTYGYVLDKLLSNEKNDIILNNNPGIFDGGTIRF
ncbi:M57 family metalloprotease [Flavobacterium daemonense]|uniref:M57 family metalloprotease n=1 Tax=Flavobacterium daemonense TaxID=1393049 RepID=UPI001185AF4E|nr:M57 family metalloprotease [Flavobacterium daemonense]KAF2330263.1 hypothetical protein FND99_15510 [Flavobacterium daemonense]